MNKESLKLQGWKFAAIIDSYGKGHWVEVLSHKNYPGVFAVADGRDKFYIHLGSITDSSSIHKLKNLKT